MKKEKLGKADSSGGSAPNYGGDNNSVTIAFTWIRQFRSAKNQALDVVALFHALDDGQQSFPSFRKNDAVDQFIHVLVVNIGLVILIGEGERNPFPRK